MFETLLKNQVKGAMAILGQSDGLAPVASYHSHTSGSSTYDTDTGLYTLVDVVQDDVPMVFASYDSEETDGQDILSTDQKIVIAALDLDVKPKPQDHIIDSNGVKFDVKRVKGVPGNSAWILQARVESQ